MSEPCTILQEADDIIYGDREKTYGHPSKNFDATADLWNGWLAAKYGPDAVMLDCYDVAMMMVLLKVAREAHLHKRDNLVDLCGYAACIQKIIDHEPQTRDDFPPVCGTPPAADPCPVSDEELESLYGWRGGFVVLSGPTGPVGGVEIPDTAKTTDHRSLGERLSAAIRMAHAKV